MKGLGKILIVIGVLSALLLLYVQGQIALLRVSYLMDIHSKKFAHRIEEYRRLKYEVEQLKAPRRLEEKIKELKLDLTLPKEVRVVRMPLPPEMAVEAPEEVELQPLSKGFLEFLGRWVNVAQAKTES